MPRNRRERDAPEKREAIVAVARRLFDADGYEVTAMAKIASEAGVAPNTLYWYFDDKDALLVAVLTRVVQDALLEYASLQAEPVGVQMAWLFAQFDRTPGLIATVHARAQASAGVRAWHDHFHQMLEAHAMERLAERGLDEHERRMAARMAPFVFEGLLSHPEGGPAERDAMLAFLASLVGRPLRGGR